MSRTWRFTSGSALSQDVVREGGEQMGKDRALEDTQSSGVDGTCTQKKIRQTVACAI